MNSRQLAQKWTFPRHKLFEKELRIAASNWFKNRGYSTHSRMSYCLNNWDDWKKNIILDEVAAYIEKHKEGCERDRKPFPLHKYVHHGLSSQAMEFNLIGPLITRNDFEPLLQLLTQKNVDVSGHVISASFEYEDRNVFNEDSGQPTSIDIVLKNEKGNPIVFVESKLVEKEFGGCSIFSGGDCSGQNPLSDKGRCYLHFIGRKYWDLIEKYGFSETLKAEQQCIFVAHYQYFREVLFSLEKDGTFVLLSDQRSPVFHCTANGTNKGLMPFLLQFVPDEYKDRIASVSIQELVNSIKKSGKHQDWVKDFESKYGLA
jgi:hypothetical protein